MGPGIDRSMIVDPERDLGVALIGKKVPAEKKAHGFASANLVCTGVSCGDSSRSK